MKLRVATLEADRAGNAGSDDAEYRRDEGYSHIAISSADDDYKDRRSAALAEWKTLAA